MMNNITRMKKNVIEQIENMEIEEFEVLLTMISGDYSVYKKDILFDRNELFMCEDCGKIYGDCNDIEEDNLCSKRFKDYALRTVERR